MAIIRTATFLLTALALTGCGSGLIGPATSEPPPDTRDGFGGNRERVGTVGDMLGGGVIGGVAVGTPRDEALVGAVNRHLWRASLDTLGFLPIASTDPFTGVIATDWGIAPEAPDERFKVTAYVTDTRLRPEALRVAVFKERRDGDGAWTPELAAPETARRIEDAILVRARQLRLSEREAEG